MRHTRIIVGVVLLLSVVGFVQAAKAQDNQGPMAPPPKFEVHRISNVPHPGPPPIPADEIIRRFTANEDIMAKVYGTYNFDETVRLEELGGDGGKLTMTGEVYTRPDGQRYFRMTQPLQTSLRWAHYTPQDLQTIMTMPLFALTSAEAANYNFRYAGDEQLDQLHTYVFQVSPKQLSRKRRFFQGVVWIDDHDFAIVKSFGEFVSELEGEGTKLPFSMFETYRENFQAKYWLPTYITSDDYLTNAEGDQYHLKLIIRDTNFQLNPTDTSTSSASPASSTPPATPKP
ncbi:MAG TPA: hypothetical protein VMJ93_13630 [Verrucomicrobiae bacterium]|nr:hypothetical protein [Verrucomicrobiae bacterium]